MARKVGNLTLVPTDPDYAGNKRYAVYSNETEVGFIEQSQLNTTHMIKGSRIASHRTTKNVWRPRLKSEPKAYFAYSGYASLKEAGQAMEDRLKGTEK